MKKSTILIIFIVYLVSIVAIGFFGTAVKVYDVILYVNKIEMSIRADDEKMYDFKEKGTNEQGNTMYELIVHFSKAVEVQYERDDGITEIRKCVHLTFMPKITYDSGDTANAEEEGIVYRLEHTELQEEGKIDLTERGELMCFKNKTAFRIYVEPETKGSYRAAIIIDVYVRN